MADRPPHVPQGSREVYQRMLRGEATSRDYVEALKAEIAERKRHPHYRVRSDSIARVVTIRQSVAFGLLMYGIGIVTGIAL